MALRTLVAGTLLAFAGITPSLAQAAIKHQIDIPGQSLGSALAALARQTQIQLVYSTELTEGRSAQALTGDMTPEEALARLLDHSGLKFEFLDSATVTLTRTPVAPPPAAAPVTTPGQPSAQIGVEAVKHSSGFFRLAQAEGHDDAAASGRAGAGKPAAGGLEEVVVTANKREQSLQDTAMSLSALSARDIEQQSLNGMADYLRTMPGVSHLDQGAGRNATVIRGISVNPQSEGLSVGQTVGVYFGEVPLSGLRWSAADLKLVDMERVEVLRGPQGTLYGSGSLSGAVRNIPVAPNLGAFEGSVEAGYSDTADRGSGNNEIKGVVNVPLIDDQLAVRAVGYRFKDSGYIDNVAASDPAMIARATQFGARNLLVNQDNVGNTDYKGGRIEVLWRPTENLKATLMYLAQNLGQDGLPEVEIPRGRSTQSRLRIAPIMGGGSESLADDTHVGNLVLEYTFPWASLLSSSSYSTQEFHRNYDAGVFFGNIPGPQLYITDVDGFNQEVRLVSKLQGPLQFVAGVYYEDVKFRSLTRTYYGGAPQFNPYPSTLLIDGTERTTLRQGAVFGELSYTIAEKLTLTGGVRKFDYKRDTSLASSGPLVGAATASHLKSDENNSSYKVNLSYKATENSLLYAQWSQGFRLGKPQGPSPVTCDVNHDGFVDGLDGVPVSGRNIDSDFLDSYELGGKFDLLENRMVINAAIYTIQWKGLPVSVAPACGFPVVLNAGHAKSRGAEIESAFSLARNLKLNVGASYVNAELDGDAPGIGVDGARLPGSPKYQYNAGVQYSWDIAAVPLYVRADYAFVGGFYNNVRETGTVAGDFGQINMKLGATLKHVELSLFGNNLSNADNLTWVSSSYNDGRAYRLRPRTVGVNALYRF
ncbi:MAG: TonB-dependent receptor [Gammaproteobacteria bacterium]